MSAPHMPTRTDTEGFWEELYQQRDQVWSGKPNPQLVAAIAEEEPGSALDLGAGEGGDSIWLAQQGWQVTAVDVSATALDRLQAAAGSLEVRVAVQKHDLTATFPEGSFDLVSAAFLQSPLEFPRDGILLRAAAAVAPGGLLVVIEHASSPSWAWHHDHVFPTATGTLASLELDPGQWRTERADTPEREVTGPDGETATVTDNVIAVRRVG